MHSKRLGKSERVWLRGALLAELEGKTGGHSWNKTVRTLISRGMARQAPGTFEMCSPGFAASVANAAGIELRFVLTPRGRACARQLWWTRLHGPRTPARGAFSAKTYNPLAEIPQGYTPAYFVSFYA